ncbi:hypothetical protein DL96DRAFT_1681289 [Flagelloscypha sp. PMI_526]|nr:hypothetical protein DL96DRAFT_1681289 [Flagelloscypha sp. PMI_526]
MIFQDIPKDLVQDIFELAASSDNSRRSAIHFSLVSREVQSWTDKFLFRNIVVPLNRSNAKQVAFLDAFISNNRPPRFERARKYIRSFFFQDSDDSHGRIERFVMLCPKLHSIALWARSPKPALLDAKISSLRMMTLYDDGSLVDSLSFLRCPIFLSLTHLDLGSWHFGQWHRIRDAGIRELISLTHLVVNGAEDNAPSVKVIIPDVTSQFPPNLRFLLLLFEEDQIMELLSIEPEFQYDPRIAIAIDSPLPHSPYASLEVQVNTRNAWAAWKGEVAWEDTFWCQSEELKTSKMLLQAQLQRNQT